MENKFYSKTCSLCLIAAFIFAGMHCFAQDTIVKVGGQQVLGKVMEVSVTEVKYKKAELMDGPLYIEDKATITKIKYQGGYVDVFPEMKPRERIVNRNTYQDDYRPAFPKYPAFSRAGSTYLYKGEMIKEGQMQNILLSLNDPGITSEIKRAKLTKGLRYMGFLAIPLGVGAITYGLSNLDNKYNKIDNNVLLGLVAGSGLMFGASIYFNIDHKYRNATALRLYRQNYVLKQEGEH